MDLVRFANSGTEANMIAICTAMRYTRRTKIVVFQGGYHGSLLSHFHVEDSHAHAGPPTPTALTAPFVRSTNYRRLADLVGLCRLPVQ